MALFNTFRSRQLQSEVYTADCSWADHGKSRRYVSRGQLRTPQWTQIPSGEPSESPRHFADSMYESVIVGYYTLKKCRSQALRYAEILKERKKDHGEKRWN